MSLNTRNADLYVVGLFALAGMISLIGFVLMVRQEKLAGSLLQYAGYVVVLVGAALFLYAIRDQWQIATRRKPPRGDSPKTEVWFCPYCGNLDIKGATHCPSCGKPLPRFITVKNGAWVEADAIGPYVAEKDRRGKGQ